MRYNNYCVDRVEPYVDDIACGGQEYEGGGLHIVFFLSDLPTDPSNGTQIRAMLEDESAILVTNVKAGLSAPSALESTPLRACATASISSYERELTITDGKVTKENQLFWNSINASNGVTVKGAMLYECAAERTTFISDSIKLSGGRILPDNNDADKQRFEFIGKFKSKVDPLIYETPADIFPA